MYVVGHHYVIVHFRIGIMNRYGFQRLRHYLSEFTEKHFLISDVAEHMPPFMATNRDKIDSVIVVMPLRSESVPVGHFGLFSEGYREEELAAAEASLTLEGIELIISGIIIGALVEDIAQCGREFQALSRLEYQFGVKQKHVLELIGGKLVAVVLSVYVPFPSPLRHDVEQQLVFHACEP